MLIEKEARNAEEAIEEICKELGKKREELEFEVIEEKSRGIFGLIGNKKVKVRARPKGPQEAEDEDLNYAKMVLERIIAGINVPAQVEGRVEGGRIYLNIKGDGSGLLIGRHGKTLDAIQYMVERIVAKGLGERKIVVVDTEQYRERRNEALERLALRMGEKVKSAGRAVSLQPMNPRDRRVVHLALKDYSEVETRSEGEGEMKSIKIIPRPRGAK
ncbi:MAG: Jag N-terminal domain-containing protein [Deltaproteobacteria bacterium]|nr:Jag N-terminal domain-containing protein [Deltaproteobacteria bacterium]